MDLGNHINRSTEKRSGRSRHAAVEALTTVDIDRAKHIDCPIGWRTDRAIRNNLASFPQIRTPTRLGDIDGGAESSSVCVRAALLNNLLQLEPSFEVNKILPPYILGALTIDYTTSPSDRSGSNCWPGATRMGMCSSNVAISIGMDRNTGET